MRILSSYSHCLFYDNNVTGHSNYNIRIKKNGSDLISIYMLDSNGCKNVGNPWAPEEGITEDNIDYDLIEHKQGIYRDQTDFMKARAQKIKEEISSYPPSVACFHIPIKIFDEAFERKYSYVKGMDFYANKDEDFGRIIEHGNHAGMDEDMYFHNTAKEIGIKAYLVGHEHNNNACIKYDGVYLNYGVKTGICTYYKDDSIGGTLVTVSDDSELKFSHILCDKKVNN